MDIDFHHATTYVVARLAGFNHKKAEIIAHASQYVDDATNEGVIRFDNGAMYNRISSAHKMLDYRNFKALANHRVWIPFHFLPGNNGKPANKAVTGKFINKIICRPNSYVAQDMLASCIADRDKTYGLHRLGITMHVYVDTWAHQGFAGVSHKINDARNISVGGKLDQKFKDRIANFFIGEALPLGHGTVLSYPDRPYLRWSYINCFGKTVVRDNPTDFLEAAEHMCCAMQRYIAGDPQAEVAGLPKNDKKIIAKLLKTIKGDDEDRHKEWLKIINAGEFSFGSALPKYIPKGKGSWKHKAIGTLEWVDSGDEVFKYRDSFLTSDWKLFHDGLQAHRFDILHDVLPKYGICAA